MKKRFSLVLLAALITSSLSAEELRPHEFPLTQSKRYLIMSPILDEYFEGVDEAQQTFRRRLSAQIRKHVNKLSVYEVIEAPKDTESYDSIETFSGDYWVKTVLKASRGERGFSLLTQSIADQLARDTDSQGALGHTPRYILRYLIDDEIFFETTLSIEHHNFKIAYPDDKISNLGYGLGFDFNKLLEEIQSQPQRPLP